MASSYDSLSEDSEPSVSWTSSATPMNVVSTIDQYWRLERRLGSGSQGQVWLARSRTVPTKTAAVKLVKNCADAQSEVAAYERLRTEASHPHVVDVLFGALDGCAPLQRVVALSPFPILPSTSLLGPRP